MTGLATFGPPKLRAPRITRSTILEEEVAEHDKRHLAPVNALGTTMFGWPTDRPKPLAELYGTFHRFEC